MELSDCRRLTGASLLLDGPGAILDVTLGPEAPPARAVETLRDALRRTLDAVGWGAEQVVTRTWPGGVSVAFTAPLDALYAATEVGEEAFAAARQALAGEGTPALGEARGRLLAAIAKERDPRLVALAEAAAARGKNFCGDDEWTTVGMGRGGRTWPTADLPAVEAVPWEEVHDVPCALVTGTNGKTTTVRLLVAIARAAGRIPGASSTDWIQVGDELLDRDDWSGPGGARAVLKDERVEVAILETARGGLARRGLAIPRADVAVVTNVAADHLGEKGVHDLATLTELKFVVRRAADRLVLNADDPEVRRRGQLLDDPVTWVTARSDDPLVAAHVAAGGAAAWCEEGELCWFDGAAATRLLPVEEVPITLGGAARFNVSNALCAAAAALHLGLGADAVREGLRAFTGDADTNPGRLNDFTVGGVRALVDFAHNPHGMQALFDLAAALPHERLVVLLGQAGDREDDAILELARAVLAARPDLVVVKQMNEYLRGRGEDEVVKLLDAALRDGGLPADRIEHAPSELAAARRALEQARAGDLLLLLCHAQRTEVLALLSQLRSRGWRAGDALPGA